MSSNIDEKDVMPREAKVSQMPITETTKSNVKTMPNAISTIVKADTNFIKHLFKVVQGVKYDALCPHGLPYYACMSCSH
jgi:hypothetical protein